MKSVTLLLLLALFIYNNLCDDGFLSKFHQNTFKIKDFRIELIRYNETYYNFIDVKTYKYNRSTPAANATFNLKIALKDKVEVLVQVFKFLSNEYRHFPVRFQVNLKKAAATNVIGLDMIKNCGNIKAVFFEKDVTYYICNFFPDATQFPPLVPNGRFRIDVTLLYLQEEFALLYGYGEVYIPIPYPKN